MLTEILDSVVICVDMLKFYIQISELEIEIKS